eukprot:2697778-Amphidinium_carterae.3
MAQVSSPPSLVLEMEPTTWEALPIEEQQQDPGEKEQRSESEFTELTILGLYWGNAAHTQPPHSVLALPCRRLPPLASTGPPLHWWHASMRVASQLGMLHVPMSVSSIGASTALARGGSFACPCEERQVALPEHRQLASVLYRPPQKKAAPAAKGN